MLILFHDTLWGMPLNTALATEGVEFSTDRGRFEEADAVVFHIPEWPAERIIAHAPWEWELLPKKRQGQLWVAWSMECEVHFRLLSDMRFMQHFDLTMTYHLDADVPATYVPGGPMHEVAQALRSPRLPKRKEPLLVSFISSGLDRSGRRNYLQELALELAIDSYGKFMNNQKLDTDSGHQSKLETISQYKFTIAFENASRKDYVTEKLFQALMAGSVPVYLGAPNVNDFVPGEHCFIDAADFESPRALAEYLKSLARDDDAYNAYFAWKQKPFLAGFEKLQALEVKHPLTRLSELIKVRRAQTTPPNPG
jgi:hypothetical protein